MKRMAHISNKGLCFSQWSRKGYAVFAGLGKRIRISALALHVCRCALLKSAEKGLVVDDAGCADDFYTSMTMEELFTGLPIAVVSRNDVYGSNLRMKK